MEQVWRVHQEGLCETFKQERYASGGGYYGGNATHGERELRVSPEESLKFVPSGASWR